MKKKYLNTYFSCTDTYTDAVNDSKLHNIDILSDPSDQERLKKSRSERNKRNLDNCACTHVYIYVLFVTA